MESCVRSCSPCASASADPHMECGEQRIGTAAGQVFLRPPRFMLRNLVDLSQNAADGTSSLLGTPVVALYAAMTFVM